MAVNVLKGTFYAKADIGRVRITNEDQAKAVANALGDVLLIVCDGIGGGKKGDYAANVAMGAISKAFLESPKKFSFQKKSNIVRTLKQVNLFLYRQSEKDKAYQNMGTTFICALISKKEIMVFNIGDSRCYGYENRELSRYSDDQSYAEYLAKTGKIKEGESVKRADRHILMNALGIYPTISIDIQKFQNRGQSVLLCSDGLYNNVSEKDIASSLSTDELVNQKVISLIELANLNGGSDNIGISLWEADHDKNR